VQHVVCLPVVFVKYFAWFYWWALFVVLLSVLQFQNLQHFFLSFFEFEWPCWLNCHVKQCNMLCFFRSCHGPFISCSIQFTTDYLFRVRTSQWPPLLRGYGHAWQRRDKDSPPRGARVRSWDWGLWLFLALKTAVLLATWLSCCLLFWCSCYLAILVWNVAIEWSSLLYILF